MKQAFGTVEGVGVDEENEGEALVTIRCTVDQGRAWALLLCDRVKAVEDGKEEQPSAAQQAIETAEAAVRALRT